MTKDFRTFTVEQNCMLYASRLLLKCFKRVYSNWALESGRSRSDCTSIDSLTTLRRQTTRTALHLLKWLRLDHATIAWLNWIFVVCRIRTTTSMYSFQERQREEAQVSVDRPRETSHSANTIDRAIDELHPTKMRPGNQRLRVSGSDRPTSDCRAEASAICLLSVFHRW